MTIQEAGQLYSKVELKFAHYYKYRFSFTGKAPDGAEIYASQGGDHNDIYRLSVDADKGIPFGDEPQAWWDFITITKDGQKIFEWNDW